MVENANQGAYVKSQINSWSLTDSNVLINDINDNNLRK